MVRLNARIYTMNDIIWAPVTPTDNFSQPQEPPIWSNHARHMHYDHRARSSRNCFSPKAIARLPPAGTPLIRSCSAADTALCISTIVGYVVTLTLAFLLHKQVNAVQEYFNKCTSGVPSIFRRNKPTKNPKPRTQPT